MVGVHIFNSENSLLSITNKKIGKAFKSNSFRTLGQKQSRAQATSTKSCSDLFFGNDKKGLWA